MGAIDNVKVDDAYYLLGLAMALRRAVRSGADVDDPEGTRYIQIGDKLTESITVRLECIGNKMAGRWPTTVLEASPIR